ncbi:MAG: TonB-dependent receptor [Bacteroidota bacterium]|nr:TonB-dependent receptor [Bacteroidota bacterium]
MENIVFSGKLTNEPLTSILDQSLAPSPYSYFIYKDQYVVLLRKTDVRLLDTTFVQRRLIYDSGKKYKISGVVKNLNTGEPLSSARIAFEEANKTAITDKNGYYEITLPGGVYHMEAGYIGLGKSYVEIMLDEVKEVDIFLDDEPLYLKELVITSQRMDANVSSNQMSNTHMSIAKIKKLPPFMGEVDVMKNIMALPGVTSAGEGNSSYNVRGGGNDQNLIMMDESLVYNTGHLFGMFSVYNPDIVRDLTFFKGGIPAKYGGRISSVMDVQLKEGRKDHVSIYGGVGLISSRLAIEGPSFIKNGTFILAGRVAYPEMLTQFSSNAQLKNSKASFFDGNFKYDQKVNARNNFSLSLFAGKDQFQFLRDTTIHYGSENGSLRWRSMLSDNLFGSFTASYSNYRYNLHQPNQEADNAFSWKSKINFYTLKSDFNYVKGKHNVEFGVQMAYHYIQSGQLMPGKNNQALSLLKMPYENALESALYVQEEFKLSPGISITAGVRQSFYQLIGPAEQFIFDEDRPRSPISITDTLQYKGAGIIKNYLMPEPRVLVNFMLRPNTSIKLSYNRTRQYIHLISNSTSITPLDIWKLSGAYILPQTGDQAAIGLFNNLFGNTVETSLEIYYKHITNIVDYKDGANIYFNETLEADLLNGQARSYGIELMAKKNFGRLSGWANYTFSRTFNQVDGEFPESIINNGNPYPSNFDRPHMANFASVYQINKRVAFSLNFIYNSGRPVTVPDSRYNYKDILIPNFPERNNYRLPAYHRLDMSITIEPNHRRNKKYEGNWSLSVYNVYSRNNIYSVFFKENNNRPESYKLSVIGAAIPTITYNFKILP